MCSTAAARHAARPGRAQLPTQPCAVTRSCTAPHVLLQPPAPTGNLWAATEGCVGSWTLWQPGVCHHNRALECCSSHTDRACQAADTAGRSLLPEEEQQGAGPCAKESRGSRHLVTGKDKSSPFSQAGRWLLECFHQCPQDAPAAGQHPARCSRPAALPSGHSGRARATPAQPSPASTAVLPPSPLRLLQSRPPPGSGAAAMQKEQPRCRLAQAQLPPRAGRGGGCRPWPYTPRKGQPVGRDRAQWPQAVARPCPSPSRVRGTESSCHSHGPSEQGPSATAMARSRASISRASSTSCRQAASLARAPWGQAGNARGSSELCPSLIHMQGDKQGCTEGASPCPREQLSPLHQAWPATLSNSPAATWQEPDTGAGVWG